jgi:hypothetical protein
MRPAGEPRPGLISDPPDGGRGIIAERLFRPPTNRISAVPIWAFLRLLGFHGAEPRTAACHQDDLTHTIVDQGGGTVARRPGPIEAWMSPG